MLSRVIAVTAGGVVGAAIWAFSQELFGKNQPWDAEFVRFSTALAFAGLLIGLAYRELFWLGAIGLYVGQLVVLFSKLQTDHSLSYLFVMLSLTPYTLIAFATASAGFAFRHLLTYRRISVEKCADTGLDT